MKQRTRSAARSPDPESETNKRERTRDSSRKPRTLPAKTPPPGAPIVTVTAPPVPIVPVYKRWQLWTAVGGVVAGSAALAIGLTVRSPFDPGERETFALKPALTVQIP